MDPSEPCHSLRGLVLMLLLTLVSVSLQGAAPEREVEIILVTGAPGEETYAERFEKQVTTWKEAATKAAVNVQVIGKDDGGAAALEAELKKAVAHTTGQLWLVFIGHGTYDGREAKFNLRGPDVSARQLSEWLKPMQRELVVIHTASASAGFLSSLATKNRVIVTATQGADEVFYARFGEFFAPAIAGLPEADLDQDKQVSVREAFVYASKEVAEFYEKDERLATEHALMDDNGDGVGTRAEVFAQKNGKEVKDGSRAAQIVLVLSEEERRLSDAQRAQRDELERQLEVLKAKREAMEEALYYRQLETLMRELAKVYST